MSHIRRIFRVLYSVACAVMFIIGLFILIPKIFGLEVLGIKTASMGSLYPVGSLVWIEPLDPETISSGDVISFVINDELVTVTHRAVENNPENRWVYTKGDSSNEKDPNPVPYENVIGKVKFRLPFLGYLILISEYTFVKVLLISTVLLVIALNIWIFIRRKRKGVKI